MQNDESKADRPQVDVAKPSRKSENSIFSQKEIKNTVRKFILAWLNGDVTINMMTASEFAQTDMAKGHFPNYQKALDDELRIKQAFIDLVSICIGNKTAGDEERQKAFEQIFQFILSWRSANRIVGKFNDYADIDDRLDKLEEGQERTRKLIDELILLLKNKRILP